MERARKTIRLSLYLRRLEATDSKEEILDRWCSRMADKRLLAGHFLGYHGLLCKWNVDFVLKQY